MPTLSTFYGIVIYMFANDHTPPHFHAEYSGFAVVIDIRTLAVMEGRFPRNKLRLVVAWAEQHRLELLENWELCALKLHPKKIAPLR